MIFSDRLGSPPIATAEYCFALDEKRLLAPQPRSTVVASLPRLELLSAMEPLRN